MQHSLFFNSVPSLRTARCLGVCRVRILNAAGDAWNYAAAHISAYVLGGRLRADPAPADEAFVQGQYC